MSSKTTKKLNLKPLADRVIVKKVEAEDKTSGGIIIPDTAQEKPLIGEVLAVGPGKRDKSGNMHPMEVKEGDKVLFGKYNGTEVKIDGEEYLVISENDILAITGS